MGYTGENKKFSFRDGFCEPLSLSDFTSSDAADLGRGISSLFRRFTIGCEEKSQLPFMYALCAGVAECGKDVFTAPGTDILSFRHAVSAVSSDCGIFVSGSAPRFTFFSINGLKFSDDELEKIMSADSSVKRQKGGTVSQLSSLGSLYINSIRDAFPDVSFPLNAGVSCGCNKVRNLWERFFCGSDEDIVFQISDDGDTVNAYTKAFGYIPHSKLITAWILLNIDEGDSVWLPDSFHYAAEAAISESNIFIKHYDSYCSLPDTAPVQRFFSEPLFLCVSLMAEYERFCGIIRCLPDFAAAKREIISDAYSPSHQRKTVFAPDGRICVEKCGRNRLSITAQAYSSETAAELCCTWADKLKKQYICKNSDFSVS